MTQKFTPVLLCVLCILWFPMKAPEDRSYFFDAGLRFSCTQCGKCCTGEPGIVRATPTEIARIEALTGRSRSDFADRVSHGYRLKERPGGDCIFFDKGCSIYEARPLQCRTYPFWFENVRSEKAWAETCEACPGIGQGRLYPKEEILDLLATARTPPANRQTSGPA